MGQENSPEMRAGTKAVNPSRRVLPPCSAACASDGTVQSQAATNRFIVRWVYTGVGAKKVLDFREAHECKKVREVIGSFEALVSGTRFQSMPPCFTNYTQWKEGWIHFRTDKFIGVTEDQAKAIVAGLRKK